MKTQFKVKTILGMVGIIALATVIGFSFAACENGTTDDGGGDPTVTSVTVTPNPARVAPGSTRQFTAAVTGTNSPAQTVTWSITTSGKHADTEIDSAGKLTVAASETQEQLTVRATSTVDTGKYGDAVVTIATPVQRTVTFNVNGGSPAPGTATVNEGEKVTEPGAMTKEGYSFDGWYKEAGFTNKWNFETDTVSGNITLYAKWNKENSGGQENNVSLIVTGYDTLEYKSLRAGDTFNAEGLTVTLVNSDNSEEVLTADKYTLSGPDMTTRGVKEVTVTHTASGAEKTFSIDVFPAKMTKADIIGEWFAQYDGGNFTISETAIENEEGKSIAITSWDLNVTLSNTTEDKFRQYSYGGEWSYYIYIPVSGAWNSHYTLDDLKIVEFLMVRTVSNDTLYILGHEAYNVYSGARIAYKAERADD